MATRTRARSIWSDELCCYINRIALDFDGRSVRLELPALNCVHMPGAIALAKRSMPDVEFIQTTQGGTLDTAYCLTTGGTWKVASTWRDNR